jgi:hypothetical protein
LHDCTKYSGARIAKARVPEVDTGGESEVTSGGGCRLDGVECIAGAVTTVEEHTGTTILHRKTDNVKFHSHIIITSKTFNRD